MLKTTFAIATALLAIGSASADKGFTFGGDPLSTSAGGSANAGTLSGVFSTNDALTMITSYDIRASSSGSFAGFEYTPLNSSVTAASLPNQYFQIDSLGSIYELRIFFNSPLTSSGTTISSIISYEHEPLGGNRFPSGSITAAAMTTVGPSAVPEAATWAMMMVGLGVVGGSLRRRRSVSTRVSFA